MLFYASPTHHKNVILSGARHRLMRDTALDGAESKDPDRPYLTPAARTFSTTEARTWRTRDGLSLGPRTRTASILLWPAATSTFSAAIQARFTLASPATCICVPCKIEGTWEGFTATYGCKRLLYFEGYEDIRTAIAREKQLKGWRREKKLNLISHDQSRVQRFCTDLGMEDDYSA
jgi:hypothetical protein